ncbi:MAG: hypothetical protein A2504_16685 [Bdellovibrionales bacterium RIFOXYD12_FULL_39_22]|nr:MAG: hypothetical protein A2385_14540 [Bdellovibrionales bacterium RIFOXYB1_FULL_39_21]OFZ45007.1 MAG: hypothetical protein A2485_13965 [Bdellovibrionales bacterium RIFOXYC12_FULL_39_17]OFZ49445.1 MAG: hypothetical protein A2404_08450 [Bdellovibrionales bacterium RIFOXYC1_FULL_39_130]OFZ77184.1 MAG: hypothetical protein A2560_07975 [Bdellovibrionales bacterium RIFOXYD1_FULL_39_84]OFZ95629.1 MAG: hypothetical protein A2504_16685 [Bdellovibrionales bacterium RIFOXYD12_FULL_39_22]HLE11143.1 3'
MLVRVVGCHGGVSPEFKATSYLIDGKLLIDAGSVATGLLISEQVAIQNILISHPHLDHINEMAYLCDNCFGLKDSPFEVYAGTSVKEAIQKYLMNDVIWPDFSKIPSITNPTIRFNDLMEEQELVLGEYKIFPVKVNHPGNAFGFIVEKRNVALLFTQDTGPTQRIWEIAKRYDKLRGVFTECSFPNHLQKVALNSQHMTPNDLKIEIAKMPPDIQIFVGHLKPNYQDQLFREIKDIGCDRLNVMGTDDTSYIF